jgi:hypothetical protein
LPNAYCIGIVNQACQLQDMALASVYTYPSELVKICEQYETQRQEADELKEEESFEATEEQGSHNNTNENESAMPEEHFSDHVDVQTEEKMQDLVDETEISQNSVPEEKSSDSKSDSEEFKEHSKRLIEKHVIYLSEQLASRAADYSIDQLLMLLSRVQVLILRFRNSQNFRDPVLDEQVIRSASAYVLEHI